MSIEFENVSYIYNPGTPMQAQGVKNVSFKIKEGTFTALVGHTGSGKSTIMQHLNGLQKPSSGKVKIAGYELDSKTSDKGLNQLRKKVGLVFQFPESQLFEETVLKDVMFGPKNFGFSEKEAETQAKKWLKRVNIAEKLFSKSPFDLSGGQMRRVAIAGVLASEPDILCLDEPAAGLDPQGKKEMFQIFKNYQTEGHTVILVTHEMNDVARYADNMLVMDGGELAISGKPKDIFKDSEWLAQHHLSAPSAVEFGHQLQNSNFKFDTLPLTVDNLADSIIDNLKEGPHE
ncbi:energy-coupling factor transport system ATP-binding protein [Lactobacillus colini]|uniref:Energy-coupling factor transporter ATP-binding protein EcfA2 n=1 Tax=Lactobacillus colini TaxID=1819254 RepID=A0ABS4MC18_9LACO|nr:energy-coupling factor transporter ATPase [Lactobacillus colini]MBP2057232.1 energy-coupling factor transport system ATP-binding protein [Lactobacillus colini]